MLEQLFGRHLEEDEPLYRVVHKHWLHGLRAIAPPFAMLFATWWFLLLAPTAGGALIILAADSIIALWLLRNFLNYFLDAWLITDRSVIDIAWHGFFHRTSTRIDYSSIEGVSYEIQGVLGTLFRFGTVTIEKVGTGTLVSIEHIGNPRGVESAILLAQEQCLRTKNLKDSNAVQNLLAEMVSDRMHLKTAKSKEKEKKETITSSRW